HELVVPAFQNVPVDTGHARQKLGRRLLFDQDQNLQGGEGVEQEMRIEVLLQVFIQHERLFLFKQLRPVFKLVHPLLLQESPADKSGEQGGEKERGPRDKPPCFVKHGADGERQPALRDV